MTSIQITHIPEEWVEAADERDLSLAEYGRRMIRAGRRQFGFDYEPEETPASPKTLKLDESDGSDVESQLKAWILKNLSTDEAQGVDDLVALLEKDIAELGDELCEEGEAKYVRSEGGFIKTNE